MIKNKRPDMIKNKKLEMIKNKKPEIILQTGYQKGTKVVWIRFKYNHTLIQIIKHIPNCRWHQLKRAWYIPAKYFDLFIFEKMLINQANINSTDVSDLEKGRPEKKDTRKIPVDYLSLLQQKRYSKSTIKTYTSYFSQFQEYFTNQDLNSISVEQINSYITGLIDYQNISPSQQNQRINAIKFYYEKVLGREKAYYKVERPRKERKLPTILTKGEVHKLINQLDNLKHKCILTTIYSAGLRRSELINLKVEDIDSKRKLIKIRAAKGKKDRYTLLSDKLIKLLRLYYRAYWPREWLFEGQNGGQYSATSVAKIIKTAVNKAGIHKHVTPHSLRHSFATHLLEQGTNLRYIQEILGHEDPKTTQIYTQVATKEISNIRSPLDDFD